MSQNTTFLYGLTYDQCYRDEFCRLSFEQIGYLPSIAGNGLFLALFSLGLLLQIGLGIRYKTWGYLTAMIGGIALEILGYVARIELSRNIFDNNLFIIYIIGTTIGPAFFSAAIYLSLSRIISIFGDELSFLKPKTITLIFVGFDFFSLVLQAAGGAMASTASTHANAQTGINIMIAGLSTQVGSTTAFMILCLQLANSIRHHPEKLDHQHQQFRRTMRFRLYLTAIGVATIAILIRCCFRVAELSKGFNGSLANNEVDFMVLDGAMMIICVICLTAFHPGIALGALWNLGAFHWRTKKTQTSQDKVRASSRSWNPSSHFRQSKKGEAEREKQRSPPSSMEYAETA